ncbi:MAG: ATP-binding protein, partial [Natronosporangium sp.]
MTHNLSTGHLDYLLRSFLDGAVPDPRAGPGCWSREDFRRLSRIRAVGRLDRHRHREPPRPGPAEPPPAPATRDLLTGAHAYRISVAFLAAGNPGEVQFHLGTWEPTLAADQPAPADVLDARQAVLTTLLDTLYPVVRHPPAGTRVPALPQVGLAVGVPSFRPPDPLDPVNPWDRLARALSGLSWAVLVLAQPVAPEAARRVRDLVLNELRGARSEADALRAPSPLADYYAIMLKGQSDALLEAETSGAWRTGVYLLGDAASYPRLAAAWVAQFNGEQSKPEPVRVQYGEHGVSPQFTASWALPEPPVPAGPGAYQHPFTYQTLLSSRQLAGYVHLPEQEAPGFEVFSVPGFDQVPPTLAGDGRQVTLGEVVRHDRPTTTPYAVPHRSLLRHTFVAGVTGSGKTTTLLGLLDQAYAGTVPFLVIEPAKTEYRQLLRHPRLGRIVQVFTAGQEQVSPLRLNPFEVVGRKTPVSVHLDLLRSLFTASFGMWAPLPQLLEQAMHRIYRAAGWDVTGNHNPRLDPDEDPAAAYPTMSDLVVEAERVIAEQDWEGQIGSNLRASLVTRLAGLCQGGKGAMLDTRRSVPAGLLFNHPTVMELEAVGDDDDKAFLIGLLLIRLVEYRRDQPAAAPEQLRHLLVIEEAHRLLSNVARRGGEGMNDSRAKAVETFANLLAEIRAYGQGVVVADQVPVKLAPDVIKNTTLKVAHRVVDAEDRRVLAGAMAMTDPQAASLAVLPVGRAAVFSDGDDAPLLVQLPPLSGMDRPDDDEVAAAMAGRPLRLEFADLFRPHPGCRDESGRDCELARRLVEQDRTVQRSVSRLALALA